MLFVPKSEKDIIRDISNMEDYEQVKFLHDLIPKASNRRIYISHPSSQFLCKKISIILKAGVDPDIRFNDEAWTPLMWCIYNNNIDLIKLFIDAGANVNYKADDGITPLEIAVTIVHYDIIELLLKSGAKKLSIEVLERCGLNPAELKLVLDIFKKQGLNESLNDIFKPKSIEEILKNLRKTYDVEEYELIDGSKIWVYEDYVNDYDGSLQPILCYINVNGEISYINNYVIMKLKDETSRQELYNWDFKTYNT